jgi:hypothetical protein
MKTRCVSNTYQHDSIPTPHDAVICTVRVLLGLLLYSGIFIGISSIFR